MPSLVASFLFLGLVAHTSAHLSLLNIYGSNNLVGHAFGVNLEGKFPRLKGQFGDAGGDSGVFETGTDNPSPACGSTPELGPLDIPAWLSQAEGYGLPAAYPNMSVVAEAFQVNRDGGGPMTCEYNEDATATSWKPMFMTLDQAGNAGIQNNLRTNETVVMNFPAGAQCSGGWSQSACIVRCRTGVNKRFGGCFAVKLSDSQITAVVRQSSAGAVDTTTTLTEDQISSIAAAVVLQMKKSGLLIAASETSNTDITRSAVQLAQSAQSIVSRKKQNFKSIIVKKKHKSAKSKACKAGKKGKFACSH